MENKFDMFYPILTQIDLFLNIMLINFLVRTKVCD